jgi:polyhydroxyalkanoate synthesis repressor PhaR
MRTTSDAGSQVRVVKKYPNRRLYDTAISSYITLEDVKSLVVTGVEFRVIDSRTAEDLTRPILFQIIAEQEQRNGPLFSTEFLVQLIRLYGDTLQGAIRSYFEFLAQMLVEQQHLMREQVTALLGNNPLSVMVDIAQRNLSLWSGTKGTQTGTKETPTDNSQASRDGPEPGENAPSSKP